MGAAGDQSLIMAFGTFADQENVWLPSSYIEMGVATGGIAHLDSAGLIPALGDGSTYIFTRRGSVTAVTVLTVYSPPTPPESSTSTPVVAHNPDDAPTLPPAGPPQQT